MSVDKAVLDDIHRYWFGELKSPDDLSKEKSEIWFNRSDATDAHIRDTYGRYLPEAAKHPWDIAGLTPRQAIGLLVLLDQFPRNIFRTSGEAFAYDPLARKVAHRLIAGGTERFAFVERAFLYLPLEHSEDVEDQDHSVFLFADLAIKAPPALKEYLRNNLDFATRHRDLIRKFGRFPHRNAVLGRQSTPEEEAFIKEHGRGY
jgi:uncharacterized protein (DUF924 family)